MDMALGERLKLGRVQGQQAAQQERAVMRQRLQARIGARDDLHQRGIVPKRRQ
jgi:hypothetical protein